MAIQPHLNKQYSWYDPRRYDTGLSELIQAGTNVIAPKAYASSGGSNLFGPAEASNGGGGGETGPIGGLEGPDITKTGGEPGGGPSGGSGGGGGDAGPAPSNLKDPNANPGDGWFWDAADGWKRSGGGSSTAGPSQAEIDAAFSPLFSAFNQAESAVRGNYQTDVAGVDKRYQTYDKQYEDERSRLRGEAEDKQSDFNQTLRSALDEAVRAYNALDQQRIARFGGGSSAGQAVGELARQEFFRQQGNVQQEGVRGEREFAKEFANIGQFIAQKKSELDLWKEEALGELKKNLNTQLANIQSQRGQAESAKAQARLSIIQDSINRARAIQDQDTQFRQNLAIAGLNQLQESAGRTFTPEEINAVVKQFMGGDSSIGATQASSGIDPRNLALYNPNARQTQDELSNLQGIQGATA